ncbi:S-adenosyl-L-methionine-dependent tRNA 4-demethylwyosine synthase-like [Sinocyclocheilus anshuiensis]|uniref:S-adenosyl-L-methionine-dependent tRNA 4-demethylwyosine synthase-like n=1 Tax=Sinocyclocheilus anshuiensis TaxID=1608454 RepID=UPI0007BA51AC|nr:PREDICTED: S-adenosyl-L-methionine-dependent tRNA 4-demethylwyosine synthase-like [Sinocyclocheilus anshuiensis]
MSGVLNDVWDYTESYLLTVWQNRLYVYTTAAVLIGVCFTMNMLFKKKKTVDPVSPWLYKSAKKQDLSAETEKVIHVSGVKVFYGSQTGTAKGFAKELAGDVSAQGIQCDIIDMKEYDPEDRLTEECTSKMICVFLVATYRDGQPTESAEWFSKWLEEASTDFRYGKTYLKGMRYAVFGLGNSVYVGHYNTVSKNIDKWLWMLSAARIMTRGEGDCNVVKSRHGSVQADFQAWKMKFLSRLQALAKGEKKACSGKCKNGSCKNKKKHKKEAEDSHSLAEKNNSEEELMESSSDAESSSEEEKSHGSVIDVEDLGNVMNHMKKAKVWIEVMLSLLSISKVEIEITARGKALSRGHIGSCGTGGSWSGLSSFWLAVSLNVSAAQPELYRATACITAVTCMGGWWEMERFQLKRAAPFLSV